MSILNVIIGLYGMLLEQEFDPLEEVQDYPTSWLWHYNHERPHKANKRKPPLMAP